MWKDMCGELLSRQRFPGRHLGDDGGGGGGGTPPSPRPILAGPEVPRRHRRKAT